MGNILAGSEIIELGIEIEKNGRDFYNALIRKTKNPKAGEVFKYLSQEEEKHILVFQGLLKKVEKYEPAGLDAEQYSDYMRSLASGYVFTLKDKGAGLVKAIKSDREAVDMGIGFEKDSIIFYEGMKRFVPDYEQKAVDGVIAQEQLHLKQLTDLKSII